MAGLEPGLWNAWLMAVPFLALLMFMVGFKKDVIARMSDMAGYTRKEKIVTIMASLSPYPFLIATFWVPFTSSAVLIFPGILLYAFGMVLCAASLRVIIKTPPDEQFIAGPYRWSRNPMYVAATAVFAAICLSTACLLLTGYLLAMVWMQHFMILAEERACRSKYEESFDRYLGQIPRYLFF